MIFGQTPPQVTGLMVLSLKGIVHNLAAQNLFFLMVLNWSIKQLLKQFIEQYLSHLFQMVNPI